MSSSLVRPRIRSGAASLLFWLLTSAVITADEVPLAQPPASAWLHEAQAEARIREALARPTTLAFDEMELSKVLRVLAVSHDIEIVVDKNGLEDAGVASDSRITLNLKSVTLRTALRQMLRDLELTYVIEDGLLQITSTDRASERPSTRVYAVADLVAKGEDGQVQYDDLIELLATMIAPTSWSEGGPYEDVQPYAGTLVIRQTEQVHEEIAQLLAEIRAVARLDMLPTIPAAKPMSADVGTSPNGGGFGGAEK